MIQLEGIRKFYQGRCVLDIPLLSLKENCRYALIGPNGSGKSTLLRILAGVLQPDEGTVALPADIRNNAGYMPQHPYAYGISVLRNTMLALPKGSRQEQEKLAWEALRKVGMQHLAHAKGNRLSGGETQRMSAARMLVRARKLLIMDEPTSATDIAGNTLVETALQEYHAATRCTLLLATHSPAQASRMADEVIILSHGVIVEQGLAQHVLYQPESEEASAFLQYWRLDGGNKEEAQCCK